MTRHSVKRIASARIPTEYGLFQLGYYSNTRDNKAHLALSMGENLGEEDVLVRVHSECLTGDVFGSLRCDCGEQLEKALQLIADEGRGVVVYLRQEGRGIGLLQKLHAYNLQDAGHDTVEANLLLGHRADERDYSLAARILEDIGIRSIRLITNNPAKIESLEGEGIPVTDRIVLESGVNPENSRYLQTKVRRMNHLLNLGNDPGLTIDDDFHESQPAD